MLLLSNKRQMIRVIVYIFVLACSFAGSFAAADNSSTEVKIGVLMPLTGEFAMPAAAFREGIELAQKQINSQGGIDGKKLILIIEDTRSDPKVIASIASKFVHSDKVVAAMTTSYPETEVGGGIFQAAKIPSLALWDSSPQIDAMGEYIFAIGPWTPSDAEVSSRFAIEELKAHKAVVMNTVEHWSELVSDLFEKEFQKQGGSILGRYRQNPGDADFRAILAKIRASKPEVIYAPLASDVLAFHKQLKAAGITSPIISSGIITQEHIEQSGGTLEGVYQSQIADPSRPEMQKLAKLYRAKFGRDLSMAWYVATGFDAVNLYASAVRNGGANSEKIKDYLYTVKDFPGAAQSITISSGGSSPYFVSMFRVEKGTFKILN
jgi:branched-chain amino acid transport system substrate-binding protein